MKPCGLRVALLARGLDGGSIFFPVLVTVTEEESAVFSATVKGMDDRVFATGNNEDEAAWQAVAMFMDIVDAAIKRNLPLKPILGEAQFQRSNKSMEEAGRMLKAIAEVMEGKDVLGDSRRQQEHEEWRNAPITPELMEFALAQ